MQMKSIAQMIISVIDMVMSIVGKRENDLNCVQKHGYAYRLIIRTSWHYDVTKSILHQIKLFNPLPDNSNFSQP